MRAPRQLNYFAKQVSAFNGERDGGHRTHHADNDQMIRFLGGLITRSPLKGAIMAIISVAIAWLALGF